MKSVAERRCLAGKMGAIHQPRILEACRNVWQQEERKRLVIHPLHRFFADDFEQQLVCHHVVYQPLTRKSELAPKKIRGISDSLSARMGYAECG